MYFLSKVSPIPIYQQLYNAIKADILEHPEDGGRLPAIRNLAKELAISNNTVNQAYQQLLAEGYIRSVPGSGYFKNVFNSNTSEKAELRSTVQTKTNNFDSLVKYNFQYGRLESSTFPWPKWKECLKETLIEQEDHPQMIYSDKQGLYSLREAIASTIYTTRGIKCSPDQIVICAGIQDAIQLISVLLPHDDYEVAFEEPGYSTGRNIFINNHYNIHPVSYDENGLNMNELSASQSRLVYLTPSHQFPTGHIMPIGNRYEVLDYIDKVNGYIIEDDYDSEFRYKTMPIQPLYTLDNKERTIYLGTFSKSFNPTLRAAYMILPARLLSRYHVICRDYKSPVSELVQHALYLFISKGYYLRHVHKIVKACERKYDCIISMFDKYKPKNITPIETNSGVHIMLEFNTPMSEAVLLKYLEEHGIRLYPTDHYWYSGKPHPVTLQMGFASMPLEKIQEGLELLFSIIPD